MPAIIDIFFAFFTLLMPDYAIADCRITHADTPAAFH